MTGTLTAVHVVARSGNSKTGPLPVTYRPMSTCPTGCPFLPTGQIGGCYGTGRIFASADRRSGDVDVETATWMVRLGKDAGARFLRDRVVGDVVTPRGTLDRAYVRGVATVARENGLVPFGYTHAWRAFTSADVAWLRRQGYVMNASVESPEAAVEAIGRGLSVALVDEELPDGTRIGGRRLVTCPAQARDDVTCASCGLCARPDRPQVVRFLVHGISRAKARRVVAAARISEEVA